MTPDWFFGLLITVAAVAAVVCAVAWKVAYEDGWNARGLHDMNLRNRNRILEREAQQLADDRAWTEFVRTAQADDDSIDRWLASIAEDESERLAGSGELARLEAGIKAPHTYAAAVTDTGAFRASMVERTDAFIAQLGEEAS